MTECAQCGVCCDPVRLMFHPDEMTGASAEFARDHWAVIGEQARTEANGKVEYLVECDRFDRSTRLCTAHDDRPPICSGYPWYGKEPNALRLLDPQCSFVADLRTLLPIVAVHGRGMT